MKQKEMIKPLDVEQLVINWHITEACNYKCQYCYSKWNKDRDERELIHHPEKSVKLLKMLFDFFRPENVDIPLRKRMNWKSVRLNFAGGETLLYQDSVLKLIHEAKRIGFEVSVITNGSTLNLDSISDLATDISILGISLDSSFNSTNTLIGRLDPKNRQLNLDYLKSCIELARTENPLLKIKINTVVNKLNYEEDMCDLISSLSPDKWKVLKMLPVLTNRMQISRNEFLHFLETHKCHNKIISPENNQRMTGSYLMIDPLGRFFQNSMMIDNEYEYSSPIIEKGVLNSFREIDFFADKYHLRYVKNK